jgi:Xaa-Pro aminopeptidase
MRIPKDILPPAVFRERRERLMAIFERKKLDAYLFSGVADLYYLTGFHSEGFYGLVTGKGTWLFASALLANQVRENAPGCRLLVGKRLTLSVAELAKKHKLNRVCFDADQMNFRLGDALQKKGLLPCPNPVEELRAIKGEEELSRLRKACRITAQSVKAIAPRVRAGMTEKRLAWMIEQDFFRRGADGVGFDLIAAVGSNTSIPHHIPGQTPLKPNSPVLFDVGCRVGAYRSDLTRSFFYGKIPSVLPTDFCGGGVRSAGGHGEGSSGRHRRRGGCRHAGCHFRRGPWADLCSQHRTWGGHRYSRAPLDTPQKFRCPCDQYDFDGGAGHLSAGSFWGPY